MDDSRQTPTHDQLSPTAMSHDMTSHSDLPVLEKHGRPTMTADQSPMQVKKGLEYSPEINHRELELGSPMSPTTPGLPTPVTQGEDARLVSATPYARAEHLPPDLKGEFPNKLARVRHWGREYFAEFLVSTPFAMLRTQS